MNTPWTIEDVLMAANWTLSGLGELHLEGGRVRFESGEGPPCHFELIACRRVTAETAGRVLLEARDHLSPLVACEYVSSKEAEEFRKAHVPFIDGRGNVYLTGKGLLVWHVGAKPATNQRPAEAALLTRAFQPAGLRFLYEVMIRDCALVSATYRELGDLTGVSLGAIGWILHSLKENSFLIELDGERRLTRKRELMDQWCVSFRQRLRPKCLVGRFGLRGRRRIADLALPPGVFLGGEAAAERVVGAIRPETCTLYTQTGINACIARLGLQEEADGQIELLRAFWNHPLAEAETVPPLLVYADLITSGSSRNAEAARGVYERFLAGSFA